MGSQNRKEKLAVEPVIIYNLDKKVIVQKIKEGKNFLLKTEHPKKHGFYKKYDVLNDDFGERLNVLYSSSIIFTLLKIYDFEKDRKILEKIPQWGDFLLSMQNKISPNMVHFIILII